MKTIGHFEWLILVALSLIQKSKTELFSSQSQILKLTETQFQITQMLKEFVKYQERAVEKAKTVLDEFERMAEISRVNSENFVGNPINAFLLIKMLTLDLQYFIEVVNTTKKLNETLHKIHKEHSMPDYDDYTGAVRAIHRLEDTYLLKTKDIQKGKLSTQYPSRPLTAFECFELGRVAYEKNDYYHSNKWLKEALEQAKIGKDADNELNVEILYYLSLSTRKIGLQIQQGHLKNSIAMTKLLLKFDPKHHNGNEILVKFEKDIEQVTDELKTTNEEIDEDEPFRLPFLKNPRPDYDFGYDRNAYERLCRGDPHILKSHHLSCRYVNHDYQLLIAPVKEELIYEDPPIWIFHDVITVDQIRTMKDLAFPKLTRSMVGNYTDPANFRISKIAWLDDEEHPSLKYLSSLVSAITNLTLETSEFWQIANYGLGGFYEPHMDCDTTENPTDQLKFNDSFGDRIATWLFYLESAEVGGATVFPQIKIRVEPKRRSAVFWHNLLPSGEPDFRTQHAGCPVLFGNKWASNKWIHQYGQEFRRPCAITIMP